MIKGLDKRLQTCRINNDFSRNQVAQLIGVSESMIGLYETGARQPSLSNLIKLASLYKVTTDYLLGCESEHQESLSLIGLTPQQIQALTATIKCFRNE